MNSLRCNVNVRLHIYFRIFNDSHKISAPIYYLSFPWNRRRSNFFKIQTSIYLGSTIIHLPSVFCVKRFRWVSSSLSNRVFVIAFRYFLSEDACVNTAGRGHRLRFYVEVTNNFLLCQPTERAPVAVERGLSKPGHREETRKGGRKKTIAPLHRKQTRTKGLETTWRVPPHFLRNLKSKHWPESELCQWEEEPDRTRRSRRSPRCTGAEARHVRVRVRLGEGRGGGWHRQSKTTVRIASTW